jgi:hypothetical protein
MDAEFLLFAQDYVNLGVFAMISERAKAQYGVQSDHVSLISLPLPAYCALLPVIARFCLL